MVQVVVGAVVEPNTGIGSSQSRWALPLIAVATEIARKGLVAVMPMVSNLNPCGAPQRPGRASVRCRHRGTLATVARVVTVTRSVLLHLSEPPQPRKSLDVTSIMLGLLGMTDGDEQTEVRVCVV